MLLLLHYIADADKKQRPKNADPALLLKST